MISVVHFFTLFYFFFVNLFFFEVDDGFNPMAVGVFLYSILTLGWAYLDENPNFSVYKVGIYGYA